VTVPNQAPIADFTSTCDGLECSFDSAGSSDPDGSIVGRTWDFGDGLTSNAANPVVTYAAAGSYEVSLTVTDDQGATNTKTSTVSVLDPNATASVTFRAVNSSNLNSSVPSVNVPAATQPGDLLVLIATTNSSNVTTTGPDGWTLLDQGSNPTTTTTSAVWTKVATAADVDAVTRVTNSSIVKTSLHLLAYQGASQVSAHALGFDTVSRTDRTTPAVPVATAGSTVISYWADKSSDSTGWTLPGDTAVRDQSIGSGGGRIVAAVSDNGPLAAGNAGGKTAESSSLNRRGTMWSIVLAPQSGPGNAGPTASFTADCTALSCSFDAAGSSDPDGTITSYDWAFGDGGTGTGVTQSRTYATPGTYTASLTVTDDQGATATTTRQVVVAEASQSNVAFRAAAGVNVNSTIPTVTVPNTVEAGDRLVLIATTNSSSATTTGPDGWTLVDEGSNSTTTTTSAVWTKVATAADAGAAARITNSTFVKTSLQVAAYAGAGDITAHELSFDTANGAARTTPVVPVAANGSLLVSYWADKSSATTTWATPAGVELRDLSVGSGSGRIVAALADSGSLAAGNAGGLTATADSTNRRGSMWSIVIAPA
jgi:PKD repeat protein